MLNILLRIFRLNYFLVLWNRVPIADWQHEDSLREVGFGKCCVVGTLYVFIFLSCVDYYSSSTDSTICYMVIAVAALKYDHSSKLLLLLLRSFASIGGAVCNEWATHRKKNPCKCSHRLYTSLNKKYSFDVTATIRLRKLWGKVDVTVCGLIKS